MAFLKLDDKRHEHDHIRKSDENYPYHGNQPEGLTKGFFESGCDTRIQIIQGFLYSGKTRTSKEYVRLVAQEIRQKCGGKLEVHTFYLSLTSKSSTQTVLTDIVTKLKKHVLAWKNVGDIPDCESLWCTLEEMDNGVKHVYFFILDDIDNVSDDRVPELLNFVQDVVSNTSNVFLVLTSKVALRFVRLRNLVNNYYCLQMSPEDAKDLLRETSDGAKGLDEIVPPKLLGEMYAGKSMKCIDLIVELVYRNPFALMIAGQLMSRHTLLRYSPEEFIEVLNDSKCLTLGLDNVPSMDRLPDNMVEYLGKHRSVFAEVYSTMNNIDSFTVEEICKAQGNGCSTAIGKLNIIHKLINTSVYQTNSQDTSPESIVKAAPFVSDVQREYFFKTSAVDPFVKRVNEELLAAVGDEKTVIQQRIEACSLRQAEKDLLMKQTNGCSRDVRKFLRSEVINAAITLVRNLNICMKKEQQFTRNSLQILADYESRERSQPAPFCGTPMQESPQEQLNFPVTCSGSPPHDSKAQELEAHISPTSDSSSETQEISESAGATQMHDTPASQKDQLTHPETTCQAPDLSGNMTAEKQTTKPCEQQKLERIPDMDELSIRATEAAVLEATRNLTIQSQPIAEDRGQSSGEKVNDCVVEEPAEKGDDPEAAPNMPKPQPDRKLVEVCDNHDDKIPPNWDKVTCARRDVSKAQVEKDNVGPTDAGTDTTEVNEAPEKLSGFRSLLSSDGEAATKPRSKSNSTSSGPSDVFIDDQQFETPCSGPYVDNEDSSVLSTYGSLHSEPSSQPCPQQSDGANMKPKGQSSSDETYSNCPTVPEEHVIEYTPPEDGGTEDDKREMKGAPPQKPVESEVNWDEVASDEKQSDVFGAEDKVLIKDPEIPSGKQKSDRKPNGLRVQMPPHSSKQSRSNWLRHHKPSYHQGSASPGLLGLHPSPSPYQGGYQAHPMSPGPRPNFQNTHRGRHSSPRKQHPHHPVGSMYGGNHFPVPQGYAYQYQNYHNYPPNSDHCSSTCASYSEAMPPPESFPSSYVSPPGSGFQPRGPPSSHSHFRGTPRQPPMSPGYGNPAGAQHGYYNADGYGQSPNYHPRRQSYPHQQPHYYYYNQRR